MKKHVLMGFVLLLSISLIQPSELFAQATTAAMNGIITDNSGNTLPGANVLAIHVPSGTKYGASTQGNGKFNLANLRIGGPYTVTASFVGYQSQKVKNIYLKLGEKFNLNFQLDDASTELGEIVVTAEGDIINSDRTGASTNISRETMELLPSISRSTQDYFRLTPSSDGSSFGGRNNKMNNFTLDGSIFNNPFGLDAATPGSQTNAQPVSLDAIDQIQVNIAPFDVTQAGFTGASVNAVTKSGTNTLHGTVFGFWRNQDLTGSKVRGNDIFVPDLSHTQLGFSIGGPIIKDKLFFFFNAEKEDRSDLATGFVASRPGLSGNFVSRVSAADLDLVSKTLKDNFGYETGPYENYTHNTNNKKALIKLDWNINDNHSLTATYNVLDASRDKPGHPSAIGRRGPDKTTLQFLNSGYTIINKLTSGIVELKSRFGNNFSNNLQAGFTKFKDSRDPLSIPFPVLNINKAGVRYIVAGHEPFSVHNRLNQNVFQITDNFTVYKGDHTITVGASFEKFSFDNSFNLGTFEEFGAPYPGGTFGPGFESVNAFVEYANNANVDSIFTYAGEAFERNGGDNGELGKGWALAETNVGQLAFYAQDEWTVNNDFTLTYGIRFDRAEYFDTKDKIIENIGRNFAHDPDIEWYDEDGNKGKIDHTVLPKENILVSPRVAFNWNVNGEGKTQWRGGTGLFTGRFPFVWVGNQVANPNWFFYTSTKSDFKFPQVWRTNLGVDKQLGDGLSLSMDLVYTKDLHAMMVRNYGRNAPTGKLQGPDGRAIYTFDDMAVKMLDIGGGTIIPVPVNGYIFTNTDVGRSFNFSVELKKQWESGWNTTLAYNYLDSRDASSIPAEISSDAFARNPALGNVNKAVLARSLYGNQHRIVGSAARRFEYGNGKWATSMAFFFEAAKGGRFSYTYGGDINSDGSDANDLIYIPTETELSQMAFDETSGVLASAQRTAFNSFIEQDDYLKKHRGEYVEKYGILSPWYNNIDFRIMQDYNFESGSGTIHTLEFSIDILNLGNFLNSAWGVRQFPTTTQPIGVSVDGAGNPTYAFDPNLTSTFSDDFSLLSRWQMQFGLRYKF